MHAVAEDRLTPERVRVMARHSGSRWQAIDGGRGAQDDGSVIPRQTARHEAPASGPSHEDTLVKLLYEEHAGPLLMFVLRLTGGDRQRAEDIVQETLLRAWRNAHRLGAQGQQSLRPWLVTVARRIAIDEHRSANARPAETYDRELESFPSTADDTDRVLQSMTVSDALRQLSNSHREILIETYFRGRTVPEAAEALNLPLGTAKSRVYYALRALRTALQQRGVTE
ncbi:RNA polymerase sigma factor [Actinoplanes sp. SE50]|uniref:sigma-70 family RNA polymerase sigma factor n=1 Tax=unclassified Actinoplanes TaxID=2626549 RepID=UPI00023EBC53|nr:MULTISPECIES: sigma-70 family RNA polymerase sigma factor [unclassified Actinoplanes]AEV87932.1 RNA polymerase sigma factor sigK [Actinoplanes sp. SE50/110]ATO86336.1 RNA polymerase sigma factor [Actinoplanes sp. SE50]SLM03751.1 RNA polymerase sigma factor [Actinoplanes sp. SE50/110]